MPTGKEGKVVCQVQVPPGVALEQALDVAAKFAARTGCVAQFNHGVEARVWYQDYVEGDGWRAEVCRHGTWTKVYRELGKWVGISDPGDSSGGG